MEKDITYLLRVEKIEAFGSLIKLLADQVGKLINFSEISNTLGLSLPTLKNYLWYTENTFIIQRVTPYFRNLRKEITNLPRSILTIRASKLCPWNFRPTSSSG